MTIEADPETCSHDEYRNGTCVHCGEDAPFVDWDKLRNVKVIDAVRNAHGGLDISHVDLSQGAYVVKISLPADLRSWQAALRQRS